MTARTRIDILLLAGFSAFLFFYGLGAFGLIGADEPRYAQVAREMLERHDWITPILGGQAWLEKPPLYYWEAMLTYSVLGVSDTAARLPSAIDATLLVVAVYLFFRRFRRGIEVDAALITASCAGVIGYAHAASMDMPLAATFSVGMLAWWAWQESGEKTYLALFYLFLGLGMLAKGPVAPFLAAVIIGLYAWMAREFRLVFETLWIPGILLFCAISLPWYVAVQLRNPQFFREFVLEHNLARFSTNLYHHPEPFWYYAPVTLLALIPWIVFVISAFMAALRVWWSERNKLSPEPDLAFRFDLFACCWLIVPIIFFSFSQSKLPGYILPAIPAGATLLVDYLGQRSGRDERIPNWIATLHAIVAATPIVPALLIAYLVTQHHLSSGRPRFIAVLVAAVLCIGIVLTLRTGYGVRMLRFVTLVPVVIVVAGVIRFGATAIDQTLSARPLAEVLAGMETHPLPVATCGTSRELEYGLAFYRNQPIARYEKKQIPADEHLLVASPLWKTNVAQWTTDRRISFLGYYSPQNVDYYWVAAASTKQ